MTPRQLQALIERHKEQQKDQRLHDAHMTGILGALMVNVWAGAKKAPADFIPDYLLPETVKQQRQKQQRRPRLQRKVIAIKVRDMLDVMKVRQQIKGN